MQEQDLLKEYRALVMKNQALRPSFSKIEIPVRQNSFQYVGGQIFQGALYTVVNGAERMLRYRIGEGTFGLYGDFGKGNFKWTGGFCFEGRLYMLPRSSNELLIYNPDTESFNTIHCGYDYKGEHHYGGVCTDDGIIYQPPRNTNHILKWDIKVGSCERIEINGGAPCRYCGSVIHPNGFLYMIPEAGHRVIRIKLDTGEVCEIGEPIDGFAFNPVVASDGSIYGFRSRRGILKIDTASAKVSILHPDAPTSAYGTKCGINGRLYSLPGYNRSVWEFNPFDGSLSVCHELENDKDVHYAGGAVDKNADIYAIPVHADSILKMHFDGFEGEIPDNIYRAFFLDCY